MDYHSLFTGQSEELCRVHFELWPTMLGLCARTMLLIMGQCCWYCWWLQVHDGNSCQRPRSTLGLSPTIRSAVKRDHWSGPMKSRILLWFRWFAPLVSRSNWSDRETESDSGSGTEGLLRVLHTGAILPSAVLTGTVAKRCTHGQCC